MFRTTPFPFLLRAGAVICAGIALTVSSCSGGAEPDTDDGGPTIVPGEGPGRLVIVGGGLQRENGAVYRAALEAVQGPGPFCVIPTASGDAVESMASAVGAFHTWSEGLEIGPAAVKGILISTQNPEAASDPVIADEILGCSGFWFTGGSQSRVTDVFRPDVGDTPGYGALLERFGGGAVVAGSSAGAAMMPLDMISGGSSEGALTEGVGLNGEDGGVRVDVGMNFFDRAVVDQHFLARGRIGRLLVATIAGVGGGVGVGVDENTAVVVDGTAASVIGASGAVLVDARSADRTGAGNGGRGVTVHLVGSGDSFDFQTLDITRAENKTPVMEAPGEVEAPDDVFEDWEFLHLLSNLAASEDTSVEMTAVGYAITIEKAAGFSAASWGVEGVEGTLSGLSAGPLTVSLIPQG